MCRSGILNPQHDIYYITYQTVLQYFNNNHITYNTVLMITKNSSYASLIIIGEY